jgi:hypothetical protein
MILQTVEVYLNDNSTSTFTSIWLIGNMALAQRNISFQPQNRNKISAVLYSGNFDCTKYLLINFYSN